MLSGVFNARYVRKCGRIGEIMVDPNSTAEIIMDANVPEYHLSIQKAARSFVYEFEAIGIEAERIELPIATRSGKYLVIIQKKETNDSVV